MHDLEVSATQLDQGQILLAVIHDQGVLIFNLDSKQNEQSIQISNIPDSLDWDADGDIWVAYNSGLRKAESIQMVNIPIFKPQRCLLVLVIRGFI